MLLVHNVTPNILIIEISYCKWRYLPWKDEREVESIPTYSYQYFSNSTTYSS